MGSKVEDDGVGIASPDLETEIADRVRRMEIDREARRRFNAGNFVPPPDAVSGSVADFTDCWPTTTRYLIDGICGAKHNVVITAQYKVGKTTFLTNIFRCLADGVPVLGSIPVKQHVVGMWSCEMDADDLLDEYLMPQKPQEVDDFHIAHLRGYRVNILADEGKAWAVNWLRSRDVRVWGIDSLARLARMAGVSENDNDDMTALFLAIDEIKVEAGVDVCFILAHTGRMEHEEGKERARGATVIDDWPDARWVLVKKGEVRFLSVDGRRVQLEETALAFEDDTNGLTLGEGNRNEHALRGGAQDVADIVGTRDGQCNQRALRDLIKAKFNVGTDRATTWIEEAEYLKLVRITAGANRQKIYWVVRSGPVVPSGPAMVPDQYIMGLASGGPVRNEDHHRQPHGNRSESNDVSGPVHPQPVRRTSRPKMNGDRAQPRTIDFSQVDKWSRVSRRRT